MDIKGSRQRRRDLLNVPPKVIDILPITQLITIFQICDSEAEAVDALG
jgi:hypothetical protein